MSNFTYIPLNAQGKPKHFLFKVESFNDKRGYNKKVTVYVNKKAGIAPLIIGYIDINTASYKGDRPVAMELIAELYNYKFDGYNLIRKDITVFEV